MKMTAAILLFLAVLQSACMADWLVASRETLPAPSGLDFEKIRVRDSGDDAEIHVVRFSPREFTFAVMDNPAGAFDTGSAAMKRGAAAAVNGGYFRPDHSPLGLVVRQGVQIHPLEQARLLSGMVVVSSGRISLKRLGEFKPSPAVSEALQAGPFLVDGGRPVPGLEATRSAERTVVFSEKSGRFGVLILKNATLAEAAQILALPELFSGSVVTRALNLDGGSSTALWVRGDPPFYAQEWKSVRTYLAVIPRRVQ